MKPDCDSVLAGAGADTFPHKSIPRPGDAREQPSISWSLLIIILYACLVNYPCVRWGVQFGDDRVVHLTYFHFFDEQLRAGEIYPRWISGLNFGAGSPIFFIQYPLPYYAAAGLRRAFHLSVSPEGEMHALGLFVFFTGFLWGIFSWLWCRALTNPPAALFASLACLTIPYVYSGDVYSRAAIGEYSALAWIPLALFFCHKLDTRPLYALAGIASAFTMVILSNVLTAFLCMPFLVLYAASRVSRSRAPMTVFLLGCGLALGVGLSGIYFLPMMVHRQLFSMANLVRLGPDIFFYKLHLFPYGKALLPGSRIRLYVVDVVSWVIGAGVAIFVVRRRNAEGFASRLLSGLAAFCLILTCLSPLLALAGFSFHQEIAAPRVIETRSRIFLASFLTLEMALLAYASLRKPVKPAAQSLLLGSLACFFMATRWSEGIWQHLPFLWNIQFPWRLEGLLSIFSVGLFALAVKEFWDLEWRTRRTMFMGAVALAFMLSFSGILVFDTAGNYIHGFPPRMLAKVETMYPAYASISRLPTSQELGADDGLIDKVAFVEGDGTAILSNLAARHLRLEANCLHPCALILKLVYYPLWRALDSSNLSIQLRPSASRPGLTELSLPAGPHEIDLELGPTRAERAGAWLTLSSAVVTLLLFCLEYGKRSSLSGIRSLSVYPLFTGN